MHMTAHLTTTMNVLVVMATALALGACYKSESSLPPAKVAETKPAETTSPARKVTILGDTTRISLIKRLAEEGNVPLINSENSSHVTLILAGHPIEFTTALIEDVKVKAQLSAVADGVILSTDATVGTLPVHREDILLARQMSVSSIITVLTKTNLVTDPELLDLEELEGRELLNKYKMDGDNSTFLVDSPGGKKGRKVKDPPRDLASLGECILNITPHVSEPPLRAVVEAKASFYVLTSQELYLRGVTQPPRTGTYSLIVRGQAIDATAKFDGVVDFGANIDGVLGFNAPINLFEGDRFVLLRDGHIAVAGVITAIPQK